MPADSPSSAEATASPPDAGGDAGTASDSSGPPDPPDPPSAVEWGPVRFERLRSLALGGTVTLGGLVLAALVVVALGFGASLLGGEGPPLGGGGSPSSMWALIVLLFVGGPMSLLYWLVAYDRTSPERRRELRSQFGGYSVDRSQLRTGWTFAGAGAALAFVAAAFGVGPVPAVPSLLSGVTPLLVATFVSLPILAGSKGTDVRLDPQALSVERTSRSHDRTRSDDRGSGVRTRRVDLPRTTLFLLAYRGNAWYRSTPWLFVPTELADDVERGLDEALARSDGPDRASVPERVILALLGSASVVVGLAMTVAAGEGAAGALLTLLTAPFSLLFLALAARL